MIFLLLFIISVLLCGTIFIGPFSIRVYVTIMMVGLLFFQRQKLFYRIQPWNNSIYKTYIAFIIVMAMSLLASGDFLAYNFPKKFLANYFVCIVCYFSLYAFVKTNNRIYMVCMVLSFILMLNSVVTILQFTGNSYGWLIGNIFEDISRNEDIMDSHGGDLLGLSLTPGIFGSTVTNAFMIAVLSPIALYCSSESREKIYKIIFIICYVVSFIACFATQQRAAFGLFLVGVAFAIIFNIRRKPWLIILVVFILLFVFNNILNYIENTDFGRLLDTDNTSRDVLKEKAVEFIYDNLLFGGPVKYAQIAGLDSAHHLLYDSWITAGFLGFIFMIILFYRSLKLATLNIITDFFKKRNSIYVNLSFMICMVYGLVHNTSYLSGDCIVFIMLAIVQLSMIHEKDKTLVH